MPDISPYANGLSPWFGLGGHPEVTSEDMGFTRGREHDYRTRRLSDEDFVAEQRPQGGAWKELSRGHKTAYIAGIACAQAEGKALSRVGGLSVPPEVAVPLVEKLHETFPAMAEIKVPQTGRIDASKENKGAAPRKLSAVERLLARDRAEGKG